MAGFGGFSGATQVANDDVSALPAELALELRRLNKRDTTTKLKALAALAAYASGCEAEDAGTLLPAWLPCHARLATDPARGVRAGAAKLSGMLATRARRAAAPHGRPLITLLWPARFDDEPDVAATASAAFEAAFPGAKAREALAFAAGSLREAALAALALRTPAELPEPAPANAEEGMERLSRVHATALHTLAALPAALAGTAGPARQEALEAAAFAAEQLGWLTRFTRSPDVRVRAAAAELLGVLAPLPAMAAAAAPHALRLALSERVPAALAAALAAAVPLARSGASGAAWRAAAAAEPGGMRGLSDRLAGLFRSAFHATPAASCHFALPLLALAPEGDASEAEGGGDCALLDALWDGLAAVPAGDATGRAAVGEAYADCVAFVVLRAGASASCRGADPAKVQSALLQRSLGERPLKLLLGASAGARDANVYAACLCRALGTLAGKASCATGVVPAFWDDSAAAVASAVQSADLFVERGAALLRCAHGSVGDSFARPLVEQLIQLPSNEGGHKLLALVVKLHGLQILPRCEDTPIIDKLLASFAADGRCDAGRAAVLVAVLECGGAESRWEDVLRAVVPLGFASLSVLIAELLSHTPPTPAAWQHRLLDEAARAAVDALGAADEGVASDAATLVSVCLQQSQTLISPSGFDQLAAALAANMTSPASASTATRAVSLAGVALRTMIEPTLAAALFARSIAAQPADVGSDSELEDQQPLDDAEAAVAARAAQEWLSVRNCVAGLLRNSAENLAAVLGRSVRLHVAASPAPHAGRAAVMALCAVPLGDALQAALDASLAPAGGWPVHASISPEQHVADAKLPADWFLRCTQLAAALVDVAGPAIVLHRRPWLAAELLCTDAVPLDVIVSDAQFCSVVARQLLEWSKSEQPATAVTARGVLRRLLASCTLPVEEATEFLSACLPSGLSALTVSSADLAEAVVPALTKLLRTSGTAGVSAAEAAAVRASSLALELLRRRGADSELLSSLALRCAASAFPRSGDEAASAGKLALAAISAIELDSLLSVWSALSAAHAASAAAAAALRRAGGPAGGTVAAWSPADAGVAAFCVPLLQCAWPRLKREDCALLFSHLRRWAAAGSSDSAGIDAACTLLALLESLPVAVAEPLASGAGGDVVPFAAAGAASASLASELAAAGWPHERAAVYASLLSLLFNTGAARLGGEQLPIQLCRGRFASTCASAPQGTVLAAANAADVGETPGAIASLFALLRLSDISADAGHLAAAAFSLLSGDALRSAAVLGLDCRVADCERVLKLADEAAEAAGDSDSTLPSTPLAAAEAACLREPLAALLAMPGGPPLLPWALLLRAFVLLPEAQAERLATFTRNSGRLPMLLDACLSAAPLPSQRAARGVAWPPAAMAAWAAAADPAAALASAPSLTADVLAAALLGAALRGCPAECRAWFIDLHDAGRAALLEAAVGAHLSPALVEAELAEAAKLGGTPSGPGLSVRVSRAQRLVTAAYALDDATLEVAVRLPVAYPLRVAEATCVRREGVAEARLRKWLLAIAAALRGGRGVAAALQLWAASCEREFAGVEPCPICFSTLHASTRTLPRLACRQCRNCFHAACLYAWFQSSNKSSCPICQTPWGTVVR